MQIESINDYKRRIRWVDPRFVNGEQRAEFALSSILQVKFGETWETIPEANHPSYKTVNLGNTTLIDPNTELFVESGGVGFYTWLTSLTAEQIGILNPTDIVFQKIAIKMETLMTENNQW